MENSKIVILPGDGIGPEIVAQAVKALEKCETLHNFKVDKIYRDFGGIAIDKQGQALPENTLNSCRNAQAVLFGSLGGPKWDNLPPDERPERAGLLRLRRELGLYANLRPLRLFDSLKSSSPLKDDLLKQGVDILVVRELTGGVYFGQPKSISENQALDTMIYAKEEIERIARIAFDLADSRRQKLVSVDKANVLSCSVLWRRIIDTIAKEYPKVEHSHVYVDNAAMQMIINPGQYDVMLCSNLFGDILSDEGAAIIGSLGLLPSASLGQGGLGLYEPAGGSAPDLAGKNIANPIAQILSLAMLLEHSLKMPKPSQAIFSAVEKVLRKGYRTRDILTSGSRLTSTSEMGDLIAEAITA